jgi:glycosyltransferase involved in cell wall biosynthesis
MSPRVVLQALALGPERNGTRAVLTGLLEALPHGWPDAIVTVIHPRGVEVPSVPGVALCPVALPRSGAARVVWERARLRRVLQRLAPDLVIWPHESVPRGLPGACLVIAQNVVYHCGAAGPVDSGALHARVRSRIQFGHYRRQMPRAYRRADAVVAVSRHAAELLTARSGLDPAKTSVAPLGADTWPVRTRRPPTEGRRSLLVVGTLAPYKRIELAIDVVARLATAGEDYELVLAGGAWPGYGSDIDDLGRRRLGDRWRWLGPVVDELPDLYADSHALLALSSCESFGLPALEAMRAGLPVVATPEPWITELLSPAAVLAEQDAGSVVEAVRSLDATEEWDRRSQAGRTLAAGFTWRRMAESIASASRPLVAETAR